MATTDQTSSAGFFTLPLAGVIPNALPAVNLYLPAVAHDRPQLYRASDIPVADVDIELLRSRGIHELWVIGSERAEVVTFLTANIATILANEALPSQERLKLLNQVVSQTLKETLSCDDPAASVVAAEELAQKMVEFSLRPDLNIRSVASVAKHDFCTFTHSTNVACYSTMLARALGVTDETELREIATAGMLHDLGKLEIPVSILAKPGRLTKTEFAIITAHPTRGFQLLRNELSIGQLLMVYQHHEKMDGTGYPVGSIGTELHFWARICAVTDVFEALTGKRPYRRPNSPGDALDIMNRGSGTHFDAEILSCWRQHFVKEIDA